MVTCDYCGSELRDDEGVLCPACGAAVHKSCYAMHWASDHPNQEMREPLKWPPVMRSTRVDYGAMIAGGILLGAIGMMISNVFVVILGVTLLCIGACNSQRGLL
ncbi:MAG: hypothetical protein K9W43_10635 [Candidatus Thorarchaeota archaeon]|nr:hypothetical protein [Candidatus Thorarchaeota archaeon]